MAGCCARAASGHAAATLPSATSKSRRPMMTVIRPSRARCVKGRIPRHERGVFFAFKEGRNSRWGCVDARGSTLLGLDVGRPDHLAPLLGFVGDELTEVAGRAWEHSATKVSKARLHLGVGEGGVDFAIELVDVFSWRISRCCDAV